MSQSGIPDKPISGNHGLSFIATPAYLYLAFLGCLCLATPAYLYLASLACLCLATLASIRLATLASIHLATLACRHLATLHFLPLAALKHSSWQTEVCPKPNSLAPPVVKSVKEMCETQTNKQTNVAVNLKSRNF